MSMIILCTHQVQSSSQWLTQQRVIIHSNITHRNNHSVHTNLVQINRLQSQLPQTFSAIPIGFGGWGHTPCASFAASSVLEIHGSAVWCWWPVSHSLLLVKLLSKQELNWSVSINFISEKLDIIVHEAYIIQLLQKTGSLISLLTI